MLVYVWSKRNRDVQMRFMQMFNFTAPYLPWVLLAFSVLLHNNAVVDLMGIGAGHLYFLSFLLSFALAAKVRDFLGASLAPKSCK